MSWEEIFLKINKWGRGDVYYRPERPETKKF